MSNAEIRKSPADTAARKRSAPEDPTTSNTLFRPGQVVVLEAAAFRNFDGVTQGRVQKADEFGRVVSRICVASREGRTEWKRKSVSHTYPYNSGRSLGGGLRRWLHVQHAPKIPVPGRGGAGQTV